MVCVTIYKTRSNAIRASNKFFFSVAAEIAAARQRATTAAAAAAKAAYFTDEVNVTTSGCTHSATTWSQCHGDLDQEYGARGKCVVIITFEQIYLQLRNTLSIKVSTTCFRIAASNHYRLLLGAFVLLFVRHIL